MVFPQYRLVLYYHIPALKMLATSSVVDPDPKWIRIQQLS